MIKEFVEEIGDSNWIMPIINGFQVYANIFSLTLISRRSRHHAGTRYLKRGINEKGHVANCVETEQIVSELSMSSPQRPICSSFIQLRGSIPIFWFQEPHLYVPKPAIHINTTDPYYLTTKKHIYDILTRYGNHIFMINLVKSIENSPREIILGEEYKKAVEFVNREINVEGWIKYLHFDMKNMLKRDKEEFFERTSKLAFYCILKHGIFNLYTNSRKKNNEQILEFQRGVIRSNCIDCLDRTNYFQQIIGEIALGVQIAKLCNEKVKDIPEVDARIIKEYRGMYERMGDLISIQYGGSIAHKQNISVGHTFELMTSIKRHYNNSLTDLYKQQSFDLVLRLFKPSLKNPHIWEVTPSITFYPNYENLKVINLKE